MAGNLQVEMTPVAMENPRASDPLLEDSHPSPLSAGSIKKDDIEAGSMPWCRICLEYDTGLDRKLTPCMCKRHSAVCASLLP